MKALRLSIVFFVLFILALNGCKKDDNPVNSSSGIKEILTSGTWRVTYFFDDKDETTHFTGYNFTFLNNGTVTASNNTTTVNGTWNTGTDDSNNKLYLNFVSNSTFEELNEDWRVIEKMNAKIRLEHISGGGGGTDYLTFEKN